jgi:hypothetical protein
MCAPDSRGKLRYRITTVEAIARVIHRDLNPIRRPV